MVVMMVAMAVTVVTMMTVTVHNELEEPLSPWLWNAKGEYVPAREKSGAVKRL